MSDETATSDSMSDEDLDEAIHELEDELGLSDDPESTDNDDQPVNLDALDGDA